VKREQPQYDEKDEARDQLPKDLAEALKRVGPARYGHATAHKFAPGGEYSAQRRKKQRFAIT
jgi:hypothetical protein